MGFKVIAKVFLDNRVIPWRELFKNIIIINSVHEAGHLFFQHGDYNSLNKRCYSFSFKLPWLHRERNEFNVIPLKGRRVYLNSSFYSSLGA